MSIPNGMELDLKQAEDRRLAARQS
jgi:hypothetical protein